MNSLRSPAVVVWASHSSSAKLSMTFYSDVKEILGCWPSKKTWPEQVLVSCRWRQTGPYTWKRTRLWTSYGPSGKPHWEQDVTTYSTIGGQLQQITCSPVFATWQKLWTAGMSYWTTCPSSCLPKSPETREKPLMK